MENNKEEAEWKNNRGNICWINSRSDGPKQPTGFSTGRSRIGCVASLRTIAASKSRPPLIEKYSRRLRSARRYREHPAALGIQPRRRRLVCGHLSCFQPEFQRSLLTIPWPKFNSFIFRGMPAKYTEINRSLDGKTSTDSPRRIGSGDQRERARLIKKKKEKKKSEKNKRKKEQQRITDSSRGTLVRIVGLTRRFSIGQFHWRSVALQTHGKRADRDPPGHAGIGRKHRGLAADCGGRSAS